MRNITVQHERFTVHIGVKHVTRETESAQGRGLEKTERVVRDVTDIATTGETKEQAIRKAIRLLEVELESVDPS